MSEHRIADSFDIDRVIEWLNSEPRKGASAAFAAGGERQVAYIVEIERRRAEAQWQQERERLRELYREAMHYLRLQLNEQGACIEVSDWFANVEATLAKASAQ
jgi:hypothetical protein